MINTLDCKENLQHLLLANSAITTAMHYLGFPLFLNKPLNTAHLFHILEVLSRILFLLRQELFLLLCATSIDLHQHLPATQVTNKQTNAESLSYDGAFACLK